MSGSSKDIEGRLSFMNQQKQIDEDEDSNFLSNLDFIKFLIVAKRNLFWVFLFFALSVAIAYLYIRYTLPVYESSALLKLEVQTKGEIGDLGRTGATPYGINDLSSEIELIRSNLVIEQVAQALEMDVSYYAKGKILSEERYKNNEFIIENYAILNDEAYNKNIYIDIIDSTRFTLSYDFDQVAFEKEYFFGEAIQTPHFTGVITKKSNFNNETPHTAFYMVFNSKAAQIFKLRTNLQVEVINPEAATLAIICKDNNPKKARDIVRCFDSIYTKEGLENKYRSSEQSIRYLIEQIKNNEEKMEQYEKQIQDFLVKNKSLDLKSDVLKNIKEVEILDKELIEKKALIGQIDQIYELLTDAKNKEDIVLPSADILKLTQINELINQYNAIRKQKDILIMSNKENTTVVRLNEIELQSVKKQVFKILQNEKTKLLLQISELAKQKRTIEENIYNATPKDNELKKIQRLYNFYERLYLMAFDKKIEFEMLKASTVPNFRILSQPIISKEPIYPVILSVYSYATVIGFAISFVWVVIQYFLHNTIDNVGELEKSTVAPILGFIPNYTRSRLAHSMLVIDKSPKGAISEALRTIRTNIDFLFPNKDLKTISLTSTVSGEGKTFVSINLAGVFAFSGKKVLIIDMDMRRPKVHTAFNDPNTLGMSSILSMQTEWRSCLKDTTIDTLKFIPSGPIPPNPSELIISENFDALLKELQASFDIVVIDSPPAGLVTDGVLIMKKVDLPIYVVRAEYSKKGFERNINRLVLKNDFKKLCVVLNDFSNLSGYGYGYKYGYGYGYGYYSTSTDAKGILPALMKRISKMIR